MSGAAAQAAPGIATAPGPGAPSRRDGAIATLSTEGDECAPDHPPGWTSESEVLGARSPRGALVVRSLRTLSTPTSDFSRTSRFSPRPAAHGCFTAAFFSTRTPAMRTAWDAALERLVNDRGRVAHAPIP